MSATIAPSMSRLPTKDNFDLRDGPDGSDWTASEAQHRDKYIGWPKDLPKSMQEVMRSTDESADDWATRKEATRQAIVSMKAQIITSKSDKTEVTAATAPWKLPPQMFHSMFPAFVLDPYFMPSKRPTETQEQHRTRCEWHATAMLEECAKYSDPDFLAQKQIEAQNNKLFMFTVPHDANGSFVMAPLLVFNAVYPNWPTSVPRWVTTSKFEESSTDAYIRKRNERIQIVNTKKLLITDQCRRNATAVPVDMFQWQCDKIAQVIANR